MHQALNLKFKGNKKGFTLLEILVVLTIVGILSSIIIIGLASIQARGRDTRRIKDLSEVQHALEFYLSKFGSYPDASSWEQLRQILLSSQLDISVVPNDPASGRTYGYCHSGGSPDRYVLGAYLEDQNNSNLSQYPPDSLFPCDPVVIAPSNPLCSKQGSVTNKFCLIF